MPVEVNTRLLEYQGTTVVFSVIRDISERKRAEEQLRAERGVHTGASSTPWTRGSSSSTGTSAS